MTTEQRLRRLLIYHKQLINTVDTGGTDQDVLELQAATDEINKLRLQLKSERTGLPLRQLKTIDQVPVKTQKFLQLRKMSFDDYVGQTGQVKRVRWAIDTAKTTNTPLPHMAFISSAGSGKTSMAACIADAMGKPAWGTTGSALNSLEGVAEFVDLVAGRKGEEYKGGIAFIDEAHDLVKSDVPIISGMLPLLEDWKMHTPTGSYEVNPFTCIMATTDFDSLDKALRSRMGIPYVFNKYTPDELANIVRIHAKKRKWEITDAAATMIGKRALGNPRYCLSLLTETHNATIATGNQTIDAPDCKAAFASLEIDEHGLTRQQLHILALLENATMSASRCANAIGVSKGTYEKIIEPHLTSEGFISVETRGRKLTDKGREYIEAS